MKSKRRLRRNVDYPKRYTHWKERTVPFRGQSHVRFLMQTSVSFDLHQNKLGKLPAPQPKAFTVFVDIGPKGVTLNSDDWKDRFVHAASQDAARCIHINWQSHHSS